MNINVCVSTIQLEQFNMYLYVLKDYESLFWMVNEEKCFLKFLRTSSNEKFLAFSFLQSNMHCVFVVCFEKLRVLLCIIGEEHCFQELLRTSCDKKFWTRSFQVISMSVPMFGANVSLLFLVLLFNHLINYS